MIKTKRDSGIIECPIIAPHLELFTFSKADTGLTKEIVKSHPELLNTANLTCIVDANGNGYSPKGIKVRDILRLLNGKRTVSDVVKALQKKHSENDIKTIIANLAYQNILISAQYTISKDLAMLWSGVGISPSFYQQVSENTAVYCTHINNDKKQLNAIKKTFKEVNVSVVDNADDATLMVVLVDDYMQDELHQFNQQRLKDKKPWIPIRLAGDNILYGPIFSPAEDSACLHCMTNNMRNNKEMRGFLAYHVQNAMVATKNSRIPILSSAGIGMAVFNIMKHLVLAAQMNLLHNKTDKKSIEYAEHYQRIEKLTDYLYSLQALLPSTEHHYVNKRPQCLSCGDKELNNPLRDPTTPDLFKDDADSVFTSGGMKALTPEQTLKKYNHLVSPLTGIVTKIERSSPVGDDWMHVYWSGSNLAIINRNFRSLTNSIRTKSAGKGRSENQAKASALCEALERYSGVFNGDEIRKTARFSDFKKGDALHPNAVMLFSDNQYKMRHEIAQKEYRFYRLPEEDFDENALVEWSPMWSITQKKHIWVMTYQLYFSYDPSYAGKQGLQLNRNFANPDSNGAAAGNTRAEAFVQGFLELIERDAYAVWWYNRLSYPEVDIASFNDPYLDTAVTRYEQKYNRKLWVLDITNDFGIPVFVAISQRFDKEKQDICISAGAHFNPHIALLRAVCELNQYISAVLKSTDEPNSYTYFDRECNDWWQNATLATETYLLPDEKAKKITKDDYPLVDRDLNEEVQACIDAVHEKNLEIMVLDQTRPDVRIPVIKVMVPGMRHFWARFAPGRLYDVPVTMGKLSAPKKESELNPTPVFI